MTKFVRSAARALGYVALGIVGLVLIVGATLSVLTNTDMGRRRILSLVLPLARGALAGDLKIGGLSGSLWRGLILHDVVLLDVEGQVAVRAQRVAVRYDLLALRRRTVRVTGGEISGLLVHARTLRDGRLNLAALTRPSNSPPTTGPSGHSSRGRCRNSRYSIRWSRTWNTKTRTRCSRLNMRRDCPS